MKVLVVGPGASWSTADVEAGLIDGLQQQGVTVIAYALDGRISGASRWLHDAWRRKKKTQPDVPKPSYPDVIYQAGMGALERALRHQVDAVIIVSGMYLHPDVVVLMRRAGLTITALLTETPYDLEQELKFAEMCHGVWTPERTTVARFESVCPNVSYLPHAWHPLRHTPEPSQDARCADLPHHDVVFVGTGFRERVEWFKAIDWTDIDLGLYGSWDALGSRDGLRRYVRGKETDNIITAELYRRAKVGLNLFRSSKGFGRGAPRLVPGAAESLSPRVYELAACGSFFVSDIRSEVAEVFGDLVPTFKHPTEAAALIRSWLVNDAGRARVAAQLPAKVAESTWRHRAVQVMTELRSLVARRQVA